MTEAATGESLRWGAGWIAEADYPALAALMLDEAMPPSFEAWLAGATGRIEGAKAKGYVVFHAPLSPEKFVAWCAANGHQHDQAGRQAFASDSANWGELA